MGSMRVRAAVFALSAALLTSCSLFTSFDRFSDGGAGAVDAGLSDGQTMPDDDAGDASSTSDAPNDSGRPSLLPNGDFEAMGQDCGAEWGAESVTVERVREEQGFACRVCHVETSPGTFISTRFGAKVGSYMLRFRYRTEQNTGAPLVVSGGLFWLEQESGPPPEPIALANAWSPKVMQATVVTPEGEIAAAFLLEGSGCFILDDVRIEDPQ